MDPNLQQLNKSRGGRELSSKEQTEVARLRYIAQHTSYHTKKKYGLGDDDVMILCKYMTGDLLDSEELENLLPIVVGIRTQIQTYPEFHFGKIGLEISRDWVCTRSRIAVDEGAAKMYVAVPVEARAEFTRKHIEDSPFLYGPLIEVYEGYGMDVELPTKVDFILYEPPAEAKAAKRLSREDNFILKMIKERHLINPEQWQRILFI